MQDISSVCMRIYFLLLIFCSAGRLIEGITLDTCGVRGAAQGRIVGGGKADHGEYPWMVSLHEDTGSGFDHICGGVVLNENWILTAAHCIDFVNEPEKYRALLGLHKLSRQNSRTVRKIKISKIVLHEKYVDEKYDNDIALLKTATPIDIAGSKGYINGICLPTTDRDPEGYARVIGWGHTYQDGENSDTLKEVSVPIIPRDLCNFAYDYDPDDETNEITETMICAGMRGRDSCGNDSGGPLIQTDKKGVATVIGIVSFGGGCGEKNFPGVYTRVSSYKNWIQKVVLE